MLFYVAVMFGLVARMPWQQPARYTAYGSFACGSRLAVVIHRCSSSSFTNCVPVRRKSLRR